VEVRLAQEAFGPGERSLATDALLQGEIGAEASEGLVIEHRLDPPLSRRSLLLPRSKPTARRGIDRRTIAAHRRRRRTPSPPGAPTTPVPEDKPAMSARERDRSIRSWIAQQHATEFCKDARDAITELALTGIGVFAAVLDNRVVAEAVGEAVVALQTISDVRGASGRSADALGIVNEVDGQC
jgi:hypothetical protein